MKKTCMNPACGRSFTPGHYGDRQLVCGKAACHLWYVKHWSSTRKPPRGIPDEDLKKLVAACERAPFWHSLLVVAAWSGLRKGELLGLTWKDVVDGDHIAPSFVLRGQWDDRSGTFKATKTGASRSCYLLQAAREALQRFWIRLGHPRGTDRIWPIAESSVWRWFVALQRRARVKNPDTGREYRVHDLRHTAAVRTYRATGDITKATTLLGHRNPATTLIYAQERPEEVARGLDAAFGGSPAAPPPQAPRGEARKGPQRKSGGGGRYPRSTQPVRASGKAGKRAQTPSRRARKG